MRNRMLLVCIRSRHPGADTTDAVERTMWCVDLARIDELVADDKLVPSATLATNGHNQSILAKKMLNAVPIHLKELVERIDAAYHDASFRKTTKIDAIMDVTSKTHMKEIVLMLALGQVYGGIDFPGGYS